MEVDYSEKLNFSDDEENQGAKEKRDNWWVFELFVSISKSALIFFNMNFAPFGLYYKAFFIWIITISLTLEDMVLCFFWIAFCLKQIKLVQVVFHSGDKVNQWPQA